MVRLKQALNELNQKGYQIDAIKQLRGGINSAVFRVKSFSGNNYALKIYPLPTNYDPRDRCIAEAEFLNYLNTCKIRETPILHESNPLSGWALLSWLDGKKPTSLRSIDIQKIVEFIVAINDESMKFTRMTLQPASEGCQSLTELIRSISQRIKELQLNTKTSQASHEARQWISTTVEPYFQSVSKTLLEKRVSCSHWDNIEKCRIASPSDVGIHNTLLTKNGLNFLDFEYAGLDDMSKLAADWILQPEYRLNDDQEKSFSNLLVAQMKDIIGVSWYARLEDIKPLIHIKWCLIMLNQMKNQNLTLQQLQKTIVYFEGKNS